MSLVESATNIVVGYLLALVTQALVFPLFDIGIPISGHFLIAAIFSAISMIRSYTLRRIFEAIRTRT